MTPSCAPPPAARPSAACAIAVNSRRKDESGNWVDKPNYFDVTVWGAQGENCAQYLAKGRPVAVDGRLNWREWEAKDGAKRQSVDIIADSVQFLGSRDAPQAQRRGRVRPPRRHLRLPAGRRGEAAAARTTTSRSSGAGAARLQRIGEADWPSANSRRPQKQTFSPGRRKSCAFCRDKVDHVDYKDFQSLRRYLSDKGKIRSRRITGACRRHQNQLAQAVKRARELALLPYVSER